MIPTRGNQNYSKKALMWLLHMEEVDGCKIMNARKVENTDYPICLASMSTGIVQKHVLSMNVWGVFTRLQVTSVSRSQTARRRHIDRAL